LRRFTAWRLTDFAQIWGNVWRGVWSIGMNVIIFDDTMYNVTLIVAAHNDKDIVIGCDSLNIYKDSVTGELMANPPEETLKVRKINSTLALMINGTYTNDKLQFMRDFSLAVQDTDDLVTAFNQLSEMATKTMAMYPGEEFCMALAGFDAGKPGFQRIDRVYGKPVNDKADYPNDEINCYLNGINEPFELVGKRLREKKIFSKPSTAVIQKAINDIVDECIEKYPEKLGGPVEIVMLSD
jgi:hypothetical protein